MKCIRSFFTALGIMAFPMAAFAQDLDVDLNALDVYDTSSISLGGALVELGLILVIVVSLWKVYVKAGKPGWAAIIPIYNTIVMLDMVRRPWWWVLLMLIPFVGIVWGIITLHRLSRSFGKGVGTTIGIILLPFIFLPILGFGDAKYTPLTD